MLGEIIKSSEALRYHAKTAEIAGQNLAHVNDESYARQRVLSREGLMHKGNGGLDTAALEAGGLDHARNLLLDKRVLAEFGDSASLEAQKEILTLLQAALGETVVRQGVDGGLDLENRSNLADGGLARAIDDLFNAFEELSSSPDEANAKQDVFLKLQTLTTRFNGAGEAIDQIDSDLTDTVERSVKEVNKLLEQIYEVNLQIKRFELLGQGKAVTYRDNRQKLLEDLSQYLNFKFSPEINPDTGDETGFWNLSTTGKNGQTLDLISADKGALKISQDFGKSLTLENPQGSEAAIMAKIGKDGKLGAVEVLRGGSQYSDEEGPILVSFSPPVVAEDVGNGNTLSSYAKGDVFSSGGQLYQALQDTIAGASLSDPSKFLTVSALPQNGQTFPETLRRFSHLESFDKGEVLYYEGKLYQANEDFGPLSTLNLVAESGNSGILARDYPAGAVLQFGDLHYELSKDFTSGSLVPSDLPDSVVQVGSDKDGFVLLGAGDAKIPTSQKPVLQDAFLTSRDLSRGEVVKFGDSYLQIVRNVPKGSDYSNLVGTELSGGEVINQSMLVLGTEPPLFVEDLSLSPQVLSEEELPRLFLSKSYQAGEVVKYEGKYFEFLKDSYRETEIPVELAVALQTDQPLNLNQEFEGMLRLVEAPSVEYVENNGSMFLKTDNRRVLSLEDLQGSNQTKKYFINDFSAAQGVLTVTIDGVETSLEVSNADTESPEPSPLDLFEGLRQQFLDLNPQLSLQYDAENDQVSIEGNPSAGDFQLVGLEGIEVAREYLADSYEVTVTRFNPSDPTDSTAVSVAVDYQGSPEDTLLAIAQEINLNEQLSSLVSASISGGALNLQAKEDTTEVYDLSFSIESLDNHNNLSDGKQTVESQRTITDGNLKLSDFSGSFQPKIVAVNALEVGRQYSLELSKVGEGDQSLPFEVSAEEDPLLVLENTIKAIEPAYAIQRISLDGEESLVITGNDALQDFSLSIQLLENANAEGDDVVNGTLVDVTTVQEFVADEFEIVIGGETAKVFARATEQATLDAAKEEIEKLGIEGLTIVGTDNNEGMELKVNGEAPEISLVFRDADARVGSLSKTESVTIALSSDPVNLVATRVQSIDFKKSIDFEGMQNPVARFKQNEIYYYQDASSPTGFTHFVVTAPVDVDDLGNFDPADESWKNHFKTFVPELIDANDPSVILRKSFPTGHMSDNGLMVELNVGLAEAVVKKGEIVGFNVLNAGNGLPLTDAIFVEGNQINLESGSLHGYQESRSRDLEDFRVRLNEMVSSFVEEINQIYNPDDQPGAYLFGFDAILTRPVAGRNLLMEEEYDLPGREGDSRITLYRDEVQMTLPYAEEDVFSIVNTTPIFPEEFSGSTAYYRGGDLAETIFRADDAGDLISLYGSARKMQYVTMEDDPSYPGADLSYGTADDGRSMMMAYESIPFRIEGLEDGAKLPIIGDNFTFSALPANRWNLASILHLDSRLSASSLKAGDNAISGSNDVAQSIAEMGNGGFIDKVALLNAEMGSKLEDLNDNLEHQETIETMLLDQRRGVSSVSIDEEVADLMRFQRSFQASSRVLSTLDKMLEIVVMGLIR